MSKHKTSSSLDSNTRVIRHDGEYLVYTRKIDGKEENANEYLTFHPELEKILMLDCLKPYRDSGYLKFIVTKNKSDMRFTIYDLALGVYTDKIHYASYLDDIRAFMKRKNDYGLVIDHADSNHYNHTIHNLSFMTASENLHKGSIVARFMLPNALTVACVDGKYRVLFCSLMNKPDKVMQWASAFVYGFFGVRMAAESVTEASMSFLCEDAESLIACLEFLGTNIIEGCDLVKTERNRWKQDGECWFMDIQKSLAAQKELASMDEAAFQPFTVNS